MTTRKINEIMKGDAFLESCGNLYEYIGRNKKKQLIFQNINDDSHITVTYEELRHGEYYQEFHP